MLRVLSKVQKRFAGAPVLELCFDAFTPTVSGGVGTSSEGVGTYLPPVRVPELAWRERDADERITEQDRGWWEHKASSYSWIFSAR